MRVSDAVRFVHPAELHSRDQNFTCAAPFSASIWRASAGVATWYPSSSRMRRILLDLLGVGLGELAAPDVQAVLEPDAHVAAHHAACVQKWHLVAARRRAPTSRSLGRTACRRCASCAADCRDPGRCRRECRRSVCTNSGGLTSPRSRSGRDCRDARRRSTRTRSACRAVAEPLQDALDVVEGVAEDEIVACREIGFLPVVLPGRVAFGEREDAEVHRAHVERAHLRLERIGAASRSSSVMPRPPPVVMLITASVALWMRGRNCMNTAGSGVGRPSSDRARAGAGSPRRLPRRRSPASAMWSGVIGRAPTWSAYGSSP